MNIGLISRTIVLGVFVFIYIFLDIRKRKIAKNKVDDFLIHRIARSIGYFYQNQNSEHNKHYIRHVIESIKIALN